MKQLDLEAFDALASTLGQGYPVTTHHQHEQDARRLEATWHRYANQMREMLGDPLWGARVQVKVEGAEGNWMVTFQLPPSSPMPRR